MATPRGWKREHLAYCSNVHPGESLAAVCDNLVTHIDAVRRTCSLDRMQSGLWLSAAAADSLLKDGQAMQLFRASLAELALDLVTLNGFPYGNFHAQSVKQGVYLPDWSDPQRLAYTMALACVLTACLPAGHAGGSISTLPLGYASHWSPEKHKKAVDALCSSCIQLEEYCRLQRVPIQICLEMEPGCVLESTADVIEFFVRDLRPAAKRMGIDNETLHRHIGVCFDVCHQAVQFEDVFHSLQQLQEADVPVGKIQLSSALTVRHPASARTHLSGFCEPRYLHQTRMQNADGSVAGADDLPDALAGGLPADNEWRVHFHLPLQAGAVEGPGLGTTRSDVERVLDWLALPTANTPHLEVETYTWQVLPEGLRPHDDAALHRGIGAELDWAWGALDARGLLQRA